METFLGFNNEGVYYACFTKVSKDREEEPAEDFTSGILARRFVPKTLKRVVSTDVEVTPDANSSIVYLRIWGSLQTDLLKRRYGWVTAQKMPDNRSKLIVNIDTSLPLYKNFWDIFYSKLQSEGWLVEGNEVRKQPQVLVAELPEKPPVGATLYAWFDYMYAVRATGRKYTLADLSKDAPFSRSHIGQQHPNYRIDKQLD